MDADASGPAPPPRARATVIRLALGASPRRALAGLGWVLVGKRVRGWNMLYDAAADHRDYYARWVAEAEPHIVRRLCDSRPPAVHPPSIACLIIGGDPAAGARTIDSVRAALGEGAPILLANVSPDHGVTPVPVRQALMDVVADLVPAPAWLLHLHAGTVLSPHFAAVARRVTMPGVDLIFWDDDTVSGSRRQNPRIKPDWDPLLFDAQDGVTGACLIAGSAARAAAAGHGDAADAAGVAALTRRVLAAEGTVKQHIPLVLSHRAEQPRSAPVRARGPRLWAADDLDEWPQVSIIIPTRDRAHLLERCVAGLQRLDYGGAIELIIVDNGSRELDTLALLDRLARDRTAMVLRDPGPFNFAGLNNRAAAAASGAILCLLNDDVEPIDGAWLAAMVRHAVLDRVGAVGARLLYPDGRVQHAGIALGIGGAAGHVEKGAAVDDPRFQAWHGSSRVVSAVTGAALVVARDKFMAVGGMDETTFAVDFNDVDLCLRLRDRGWSSIYAADATLIHHESATRGRTRSRAAEARFKTELAALRARWGTLGYDDPHHSPRFRKESERCILAF